MGETEQQAATAPALELHDGGVRRVAVILDGGERASVEVLAWSRALRPGYRFAARGRWWEIRQVRSLERSAVAVPVDPAPVMS